MGNRYLIMCRMSRRKDLGTRTLLHKVVEIIMRDNIALGCMMLWVWAVSMVDHYLTIKLQHSIILHEKNPLGLLLIVADGGSVALFMTLKMAGLWLIFFITIGLYRRRKVYGLFAMFLLSLIQLYLVMYFFHTPPPPF